MLINGCGLQGESDISERGANALTRLLDAYRGHFDIELNRPLMGITVPASASFRSRGERYMLVKKAKIWAAECNEFAFFFAPPTLDANEFHKIAGLLESAEPELVRPHPEHMYTYLSAVILADVVTEEASALVRRYKWRKSYRFSFLGWCHIRFAALNLSQNTVITNKDGRQMRKALGAALGGTQKHPVRG